MNKYNDYLLNEKFLIVYVIRNKKDREIRGTEHKVSFNRFTGFTLFSIHVFAYFSCFWFSFPCLSL